MRAVRFMRASAMEVSPVSRKPALLDSMPISTGSEKPDARKALTLCVLNICNSRLPRNALRLVFPCLALLFTGVAMAAEPAFRPWNEYRTIMWIGASANRKPDKLPLFFQRLREMGINAGMVAGAADAQPLRNAKMPFYVENIINKGLCLKWNSSVKDWDKHVTDWKEKRDEPVRDFSLDDPRWRDWARGAMNSAVRKHMADKPLAYDIRDELSTTISANPFDYDFSPSALDGFRNWLKTQYADLAALNSGWDTHFQKWEEVKPFTSDQIKSRMAGGDPQSGGRPDWQTVQRVKFDPVEARKNPLCWNFAPWCDHRTYMDVSLARTLGNLRDAAHSIDPQTPVGIEGTQMPSAFGGYDLWRLSRVLDWVEPYDIGNAREIWGSFMRAKPILTTVGEQDARAARRRLWHLLLEGDKGCIIWWSEDCIDWKSDDYPLTPRAKALAPVLAEMRSPLARLFMSAEREVDPIAIHYSQPSIQVDWLLESAVDGSTWLRRFSSYEASHNKMARCRQAWVKLLQDLGYTPSFISSEQIENGELKDARVLVLPESIALSDKECAEIKSASILSLRAIVGSRIPGAFDEHGRLRAGPLWPDDSDATANLWWHQTGCSKNGGSQVWDQAEFLKRRGAGNADGGPDLVRILTESVTPAVRVPVEARVLTHRFRLGPARLFAFERNILWQMSEDLKQSGGNEALEKPGTFGAALDTPAHVYDLRTGKYLGFLSVIPVELDPWRPSLYALTNERLPEGDAITALQSRKDLD